MINRILFKILFLALFLAGCSSGKVFTDVNHIVHMGQSLSGGEQSLPVITDSITEFTNLRFKMGTSTWTYNYYPDQPTLREANKFEWVPLTAIARGVEGETIANGLCDHLQQSLLNTKYRRSRFLFSYAGQGGRYLRELDKQHDDAKDIRAGARQSKGGHYITSIDDVRRAAHIADSMKISYSVAAITWMQGERGNDLHVNRWDSILSRNEFLDLYKKDLIMLKNDYQHDILEITRQKRKPHFFTYQTNGTLSGTAQLMACDEEKDMHMVSATYMLPSAVNSHYYNGGKPVHSVAIHISADGERMLGEQFGKVIKRVLEEKRQWQPLRPVKAIYHKEGNYLLVRFHVPVSPIVIDSSFLPFQGNGGGFEVYDNANRNYRIGKINVAGEEIIKIELADALPGNTSFFVRYGLTSFVKDIAQPVAGITANQDSSTLKIEFKGNIMQEFVVLKQEGAFYLVIRGDRGGKEGRILVRSVYLDGNGNTVLQGEIDGARAGFSFNTGRKCFVSRIFAYGNIHDADAERSTYTFKDATYGTRVGQPYPLYNWCVIFQDLQIQQEEN